MSNIKWFATTEEKSWQELKYDGAQKSAYSEIKTTGDTHQVFDGFGGCFNELGQIALEKLSEEDREQILDLLFDPKADGLQFDYCRTTIGANDFSERWYSYNETEDDYAMENFSIDGDRKYLLPYIKSALKRNPDIKFSASPWSPPTWMKFPKAHNFGTLKWDEENLKAYALYFAKYVEAYAKEGIKINNICVQNEPFSDQKFPSCKWKGEQFIDFISNYMGPLFEEKGIDTEIFLGTLNNANIESFNDYVCALIHNEKANKYTKGIGLQWAGKGMAPMMLESFPDTYIIQTENECGDGWNTWGYACYVFSLLRHYLRYGVKAYIYWNMVLPEGGMSTWGWRQNTMVSVSDDGKYTLNHEYYIMKHFARYIKPGAVRLELEGRWNSNSIAFKNTDGSIVLVLRNPMKANKTINFKNGDKEYSFELPADSVNTIIL